MINVQGISAGETILSFHQDMDQVDKSVLLENWLSGMKIESSYVYWAV